jgi:hypothetical protein
VKITRLLVLVAFLGISCSVALADGVDPVFKLGGGGASTPLTSDTFSFTVNQADAVAGFVSFDFINFTGATIVQLNLDAPAGFLFSCDNTGDPYFTTCSPTTATAGPTTLSFFGLDEIHTGIPTATQVFCGDEEIEEEEGPPNCVVTGGDPNSDFIITVGVADMPAGSSFDVTGHLIPAAEPATLLMVLAGGLGFLALKRSGLTV